MRKVLLTRKDGSCLGNYRSEVWSAFQVKKITGFYPRVRVDISRVEAVGQAGGVLLTETVRASGVDILLAQSLARWRKPHWWSTSMPPW
jgi:hypothetical protein